MIVNSFGSRLINVVLVTILFSITGCEKVLAQNEKYLFNRLDNTDGLSDNGITSILKDSRGFMWFGTADGLCRYDGYEFKVFRPQLKDSTSISTKFIEFIFEDEHGKIWTGQHINPNIYDPQKESFEQFSLPFRDKEKLNIDYIHQVFMDSRGHVWFVYKDHGIFIHNPSDSSTTRIKHEPGDTTSVHTDHKLAVTESRDKHFWIVSNKGYLEKMDPETNKVVYRTKFNADSNLNYMLYADKDDDCWIYGTDGSTGVVYFDQSKESFHYLHADTGKYRLSNNLIEDIEQDKDGLIWIGTGQGSVNLLDKNDMSINYLEHNEFNDKGLIHYNITTLYQDYDNVMWVGTYKHGVGYTHEDMFEAELYRHNPDNEHSLSYNDIDNFVEDEKGNLWIGTNGGGLIYFNRQEDRFTTYKHDPDDPHSLSSDVIIGMYVDDNNGLWLGTYYGGLNYFDGEKFHRFMHDPNDPTSISDDRVWDIVETWDNKLWLATFMGGLDVFDPETGEVIANYKEEPGKNSLPMSMVTSLTEDREKNMWIGTPNGLSHLNRETGTFTNYYPRENEKRIVNNDMIWDVFEDSRGWIWAGTDNGLNLVDQHAERLISFTEQEGLPHNTIMTIEEDDFGNLWMSTLNGVSNLILKADTITNDTTYEVINYTEADGLQGQEFNAMASFKTSRGEILFGGSKGFNLFRPDTARPDPIKPNIVITDLQISNNSVGIGEQVGGHTVLEQSIAYSEKITLSHQNNIFTLVFADLNYFHPKELLYRYKLEGFNKEWLYADAEHRKATYTNLDPGTYTFYVTSTHKPGEWNDEMTSLTIEVLPPWWGTWWFRMTAMLAIIGTVVGIYYYRVNQLKRQKEYLESEVQSRTREIAEQNTKLNQQAEELQDTNTLLEERQQHIEEQSEELIAQKEDLEAANANLSELNTTKDKFFSIISHDLKNPFNMVLGFTELLVTNFDKLTDNKKFKYAEAIHQSSRNIYNLLENLLHWSRTQTNKIENDPSNISLKDILDQNISLLKHMINKKNIHIVYETSADFTLYADKNLINAVFRNLLTNAIKFTNPDGHIYISCETVQEHVRIKIQDTGVGMTDAILDNLFKVDSNISQTGTDGEKGTGLGLVLCKEYIEISGGTISVESEPDKGSTFYFTIPLGK